MLLSSLANHKQKIEPHVSSPNWLRVLIGRWLGDPLFRILLMIEILHHLVYIHMYYSIPTISIPLVCKVYKRSCRISSNSSRFDVDGLDIFPYKETKPLRLQVFAFGS